MAHQQSVSANPASTNSNDATNLYPILENKEVAPLDLSERNLSIAARERELVASLREVFNSKDVLDGVIDRFIVPQELLVGSKKLVKPKVDPLKRLKELNPAEEVEEEEEEEETEDDDEEQETVEDEEEDAGGDYLVSHFDNGENFEENDDEDDDNVVN